MPKPTARQLSTSTAEDDDGRQPLVVMDVQPPLSSTNLSSAQSNKSSTMKRSTSAKSRPSTPTNIFRLVAKIFDLHLPYLPTTLHLRLEFILWICTILFTISSSLVLYKQTYLHTYGDWVFLFTVGAWLGRHFLVRLMCTITWVDLGMVAGCSSSSNNNKSSHVGGSRRRRRAFDTWLIRHRRQQSLYHRIRWLLSFISPYNIASKLVKFIYTCAMAGQYCDTSAANGVASAAMMMLATSGGGDDHHLHSHHFSKASSTHHVHGQHAAAQSFGLRPHSNTMNTSIMLSLARLWSVPTLDIILFLFAYIVYLVLYLNDYVTRLCQTHSVCLG